MSSRPEHGKRKHRNHDDSQKYESRSRSRSPTDKYRKNDRTHRSEKPDYDRTKHKAKRGEREELGKKIKSEPADKGYRKYENPARDEKNIEHSSNRKDERRRERDRPEDRRGSRWEEEQPVRVKQEREQNDERRREHRQQMGDSNPFQTASGNSTEDGAPEAPPKEGPDFGLSGALTEDTNTFRGVVIKYNEPPEARKPKVRWRLYVFKGDQDLPTLYIHRQSAYLLGRERLIADLPIDHPSCSKQHAAIQYRLVEYDKADGTKGKRVRPYIIDLESANGTFLNNKQIEPRRYYEMQEKDVLKFGFSSREYVVLHEKTSTAELEDDGEL